jgi:endoglucanase Acf2
LLKLELGKAMKEIDLDLSVGMHYITAIYEGDKNCFSSQSTAFNLRVKPA